MNTYIFNVADADGRYAVVLELEGLGLVGIVFYGLDYPRNDKWFLGAGDADGRLVGVLGLGGLGHVGIGFYDLENPLGEVSAPVLRLCESTPFIVE